jgi:exopolyphosphatase/guanosine-5'-triphosphate,3'-diphosphate pyrophosphatase
VAGAILVDTILRRLGADELTLCDLALREGVILDYIRRNRRHIAHAERIPDIRRRSVLELAERCNYYAEHARQVVRLALAIFDQSRDVHGLTEREREWLEYAALLHDIGAHISFARHHRHSYYLVKNGDLRGFAPDEIEIIALIARYHRRGVPRKTHAEFAGLDKPDRQAVRALAAILRIAESLDRSHSQVISALELQPDDADLVMQLRADSDAELELWAANRHLQPFERLMGKPVRIICD